METKKFVEGDKIDIEEFKKYRKKIPVFLAKQMDTKFEMPSPTILGFFTWGHKGDYFVIDEEGQMFPMSKEDFEKNYELMNPKDRTKDKNLTDFF